MRQFYYKIQELLQNGTMLLLLFTVYWHFCENLTKPTETPLWNIWLKGTKHITCNASKWV